jgi:lysozyme family protein
MMDVFLVAFADVVGIEGRYSNDPKDSGGETMYGITVAVARAHGYMGDMRNMPLGVAQTIYRAQYWDLLRLDEVAQISRRVALELFDTGVNCGTGVAGRFLQRALNVFNRNGQDYPDVAVDNTIGPMTVSAFRRFISVRGVEGETVLMRALNAQQGERYMGLSEAREKDERFVYGWFKERVS